MAQLSLVLRDVWYSDIERRGVEFGYPKKGCAKNL